MGSISTLDASAAKGRYGVAYVRSIFSQAAVGFNETSPDEDAIAVDGSLEFAIAAARVQVKCSSQFKIAGKSATWNSELHWRESWATSRVPVYFILVILEHNDASNWIQHHATGTDHKAAAFWVRVNEVTPSDKIVVPKTQRLTVETLTQWEKEVNSCFTPTL
ncbi:MULTISPECIES: DUF4365 domain-containing protein [Streptomyces]|uniref:DUF4365 domain-containing protein n=1 Tax=Streptomyces TaxID=1883 RepID=UPI001D048EEB|nr:MULTISPECIES: DUF4365 domain-containing protein [Streptomyces]